MSRITYTPELLQPIAAQVFSISEMLRQLGRAPTGSNISHMKRRCEKYGIDISHFKLGTAPNSPRPRRSAESILVLGEPLDRRTQASYLRRSLIETGRTHECHFCSQGPIWRGKPLQLEIDHINRKHWDNQAKNLRFICPNCHSQV